MKKRNHDADTRQLGKIPGKTQPKRRSTRKNEGIHLNAEADLKPITKPKLRWPNRVFQKRTTKRGCRNPGREGKGQHGSGWWHSKQNWPASCSGWTLSLGGTALNDKLNWPLGTQGPRPNELSTGGRRGMEGRDESLELISSPRSAGVPAGSLVEHFGGSISK